MSKFELFSEEIEEYKARLEGVSLRGRVRVDDEQAIIRVQFETRDGVPAVAEIRKQDAVSHGEDEVCIRRGADYVVSMVAVAGREHMLPIELGLGQTGWSRGRR